MTELVQQEVIKNENTTLPEEAKKEINQTNSPSDGNTIPEESPQDRDWRKWRENRQKEREESARVDAARIKAEQEAAVLRQALEAVVNKPSQTHRDSGFNDDIEESEEARIDKRVAEAIARKEAEYEKQRAIKEQQEYPTKLRNTFKDFEQVCSAENLDYLEFHHPELAKSLGKMPNGFDKWADIYSSIKRYVANTDSSKDAKKADKNLQKPQSLSHSTTSDGSNMATPTRITEQKRKENWERMQRTLKGIK